MASEEEVVISPILLKPEWSDLSTFECNPDYDIGYRDWIEEAIVEQELENTDPTFFEEFTEMLDLR